MRLPDSATPTTPPSFGRLVGSDMGLRALSLNRLFKFDAEGQSMLDFNRLHGLVAHSVQGCEKFSVLGLEREVL